jgi:hypothetical protein
VRGAPSQSRGFSNNDVRMRSTKHSQIEVPLSSSPLTTAGGTPHDAQLLMVVPNAAQKQLTRGFCYLVYVDGRQVIYTMTNLQQCGRSNGRVPSIHDVRNSPSGLIANEPRCFPTPDHFLWTVRCNDYFRITEEAWIG